MKFLKLSIINALVLVLAFSVLIPGSVLSETWPWLRLWPSGRYRDQGEVIVTGKPGKDLFIKTGHWTWWYRSGQIREEGDYTEGIKTGHWRSWYKNGIRRQKGSHNPKGEKTGLWEYWYENGLPSAGGTYLNDIKDGSWCYWYKLPGDRKSSEGSYRNGRPEGFWTYWYEDGIKEKEGAFKRGEEEGPWTYWYPDGHLKCSGRYRGDLEVGPWTYCEEFEGRYISWSYDYRETVPSNQTREVHSSIQALNGHWIGEKELSETKNSILLPLNFHHLFFHPDGSFIEVMEGGLKNSQFVIEDEEFENRTILIRFEGEDGKGAILFGLFSRDYKRLVGRYYLVDFLRGTRGRLVNYFSAVYAGKALGPIRSRLTSED